MSQKITATRTDQLGMQVYSRIYAMAYCQLNNLDYIHTPLPKKYSHFEDFFNLGFDKRSRKQDEEGVLDIGESVIPSFLARNSGAFRSIKFDKTFLAKLRYKYYMGEKENSKKQTQNGAEEFLPISDDFVLHWSIHFRRRSYFYERALNFKFFTRQVC